MVRSLLRLGAALGVIGASGAVWYALAGIHGCDDLPGGGPCRMERDFTIYVISLTILVVGLIVTSVAGLLALKRRADFKRAA